jgi:hypothetical protein
MSANGRRDVTIRVPPAVAKPRATLPNTPEIGPEELCKLQAARIRELERELSSQQIAASTMANIAACATSLAVAQGYGLGTNELRLDRSLLDRMDGAKIALSETADSDVVVSITERAD